MLITQSKNINQTSNNLIFVKTNNVFNLKFSIPNMETLGEYLRKLREENELPIRKVAAVVDVDQSTMGKYERGERLPKRDLLDSFASFFNVSISEMEKRFLTDKVVFSLLDEEDPEMILDDCKQKLAYLRNKKMTQGEFKFQ